MERKSCYMSGGRKKKCVFLAMILSAIVSFSLYYYIYSLSSVLKAVFNETNNTTFVIFEVENQTDIKTTSKRCRPPFLHSFAKDVVPFYSPPEVVDCSKKFNTQSPFHGVAFTIRNGHHLHQLVDMGLSCCFTPFFRDSDERVSQTSTCHPIKENVTVIPSNMDYIEVLCKDSGTLKYRDTFPLAHPKNNDPKGANNFKDGMTPTERLNFAIIGLDAAARANFIRQMPLSNNYLLNSLNAISLEGHSIVGPGSSNNLLPLLTGLSSTEIVTKCGKSNWDGNKCPFIWNEFSKRGYVTTFAEDYPNFNDNWSYAFTNPPTDYYLRPYVVYMSKFAPVKTPSYYCVGPRYSIEMVLNFMESVREVADKVKLPYFQFTWTGLLAHDNMNSLGLADVPLLRILMKFKESNALNNTVILVLGDHGQAGFGGIYGITTSGKMEYRMPVAYIVLPPWFSNKFPKEYLNLLENSKKITTTYDIFKTLHHLMELGNPRNQVPHTGEHGISLLKPIPDSRSCVEAGVALKWCNPCYPTIPINSSGLEIKAAANLLVESLNDLRENYRNLCAKQSLRSVQAASKWSPMDIRAEICGAKENFETSSGLIGLTKKQLSDSCNFPELLDIVDVRLTTNPYGAIYNGGVMIFRGFNSSKTDMIITEEARRLDRYFKTGHCVPKHYRPYCICV